MPFRYGARFILLLAGSTLWCAAMPFFWAYNVSKRVDPTLATYSQVLIAYLPDLVTGGIVLLCLPLVFVRPRIAVGGLAGAALLLPLLDHAMRAPTGSWVLTTPLLLLLSRRLYLHTMKR